MKEQLVRYVDYSFTKEFKFHEEVFTYRKDRPYKWLQRICLWVLKKLRANYEEELKVLHTKVFDVNNIIENILEQQLLVEFVHNYKPKTILIGSGDMRELIGDPMIQSMMSYMYTGNKREFNGLTIKVIPWMKGVLLVP